jgi:predicted NUDIX family phosphoesterase
MNAVVKYPVFIVSVDNEMFYPVLPALYGIVEIKAANWLLDAQSHIVIRQRSHLDEVPSKVLNPENNKPLWKGDRSYRQVLPYTIIRQLNEEGEYLYHTYRRPSKGEGESRLAGNVSIGYGGHIDLDDVVTFKSVIDLGRTIKVAVYREVISEETKAVNPEEQNLVDQLPIKYADLFILDDTNDVGCLHVGVLMIIDLPKGLEVTTAEADMTQMHPMTAVSILESDFPIENWTRIYLEYVVDNGKNVAPSDSDHANDTMFTFPK